MQIYTWPIYFLILYSYATDSVGSEKSMQDPGTSGKGYPDPKVSPFTLKIVAP